jgi:hypothetical protein
MSLLEEFDPTLDGSCGLDLANEDVQMRLKDLWQLIALADRDLGS